MKWDCKYHVVFLPKYRRKVLYGKLRQAVGRILRELCEQKKIVLVEGHVSPDHVPMLLSIPPEVQRGVHGGIPEREVRCSAFTENC